MRIWEVGYDCTATTAFPNGINYEVEPSEASSFERVNKADHQHYRTIQGWKAAVWQACCQGASTKCQQAKSQASNPEYVQPGKLARKGTQATYTDDNLQGTFGDAIIFGHSRTRTHNADDEQYCESARTDQIH